MQPGPFAAYARTTGFDLVTLQKRYGRACASVTLRLGEVMRDQPLLAALYERGEKGELINTSPVGGVVFDAWTGTPVCFNRERGESSTGCAGLTSRRSCCCNGSGVRGTTAAPGRCAPSKEHSAQAGRRRGQPHLHRQRAAHRLPDAAGGGTVTIRLSVLGGLQIDRPRVPEFLVSIVYCECFSAW